VLKYSQASTEPSFGDAVMNSLLLTLLADACINEAIDISEKRYREWHRKNHIDAIEDTLENDSSKAKSYHQAKKKIIKILSETVPEKYRLIPAMLSQEMFQIAKTHPKEVSTIVKLAKKTNRTDKNQKKESRKQEKLIDTNLLKSNLKKIKTIVFHGDPVRPVVLFKNREACTNIAALIFPDGMEAYKQRYPEKWKSWRGNQGNYELKFSNTWKKTTYQNPSPPAKPHHMLDGSYRYLSGGFSAGSTRQYNFTKKGRFSLDNVTYANTDSGLNDTTSVSTYASNTRQGSYRRL
jgi:hypothetical protein